MKRFEVWIDCKDEEEKEVRRRVEKVLDEAGVDFTMLATSIDIVRKGSQK